MAWCEANRVDFVFGLARNARLVERDSPSSSPGPRTEAGATGRPARRFTDFRWSTLDSWSRRRRVVGKAEWTRGEANPRFVVTSLQRRRDRRPHASTSASTAPAARWRTGSRSASSTCSPTAPRPPPCAPTSCACGSPPWPMCLLCALRRIGLAHTQFAEATCGTHPPHAAQDRRPGPHQRPPHQARHGLGLPLQHEFALAHARLTRAAF